MGKTDWIVVHQDGLVIECQRCGATDSAKLPIEIERWLAIARAFVKRHRACRTS